VSSAKLALAYPLLLFLSLFSSFRRHSRIDLLCHDGRPRHDSTDFLPNPVVFFTPQFSCIPGHATRNDLHRFEDGYRRRERRRGEMGEGQKSSNNKQPPKRDDCSIEFVSLCVDWDGSGQLGRQHVSSGVYVCERVGFSRRCSAERWTGKQDSPLNTQEALKDMGFDPRSVFRSVSPPSSPS
jgi:hypothetical protein